MDALGAIVHRSETKSSHEWCNLPEVKLLCVLRELEITEGNSTITVLSHGCCKKVVCEKEKRGFRKAEKKRMHNEYKLR